MLRIPPHHLQAHRRLAREPGDGRSAYHVLPKCPHDVPLGHTGRGPASPHRPHPPRHSSQLQSRGLGYSITRLPRKEGLPRARCPTSEATISAISGPGRRGGGESSSRWPRREPPLSRWDTTVFPTLRKVGGGDPQSRATLVVGCGFLVCALSPGWSVRASQGASQPNPGLPTPQRGFPRARRAGIPETPSGADDTSGTTVKKDTCSAFSLPLRKLAHSPTPSPRGPRHPLIEGRGPEVPESG